MSTLTLSRQQDEAVAKVHGWFEQARIGDAPQVFRLFGYAGTGKTTIAKHIAAVVESAGGRVVFAAFTGKAASVLTSKGCPALTIHQLIYKPQDRRCPKCDLILTKSRCKCGHEEPPDQLLVEFTKSGRSTSASLIVVDECSMVGAKIGQDLMSLGVPILVLGDPAQLPPIGDGGFFTSQEPDYLLTEIHRQAEGCGILDIATAVRQGQRVGPGTYSESLVLPGTALGTVDPFAYDIVLVGKNDTRGYWNRRMRATLGRKGPVPEVGDRLICLRNNHDRGIVNGDMVEVVEVGQVNSMWIDLTFQRLVEGARPESCMASRHYFDGVHGQPERTGADVLFFDFAYAITVHKSQGSQWDRVLVINESRVFREDSPRWLYTGITRAAKHVTVVGT